MELLDDALVVVIEELDVVAVLSEDFDVVPVLMEDRDDDVIAELREVVIAEDAVPVIDVEVELRDVVAGTDELSVPPVERDEDVPTVPTDDVVRTLETLERLDVPVPLVFASHALSISAATTKGTAR